MKKRRILLILALLIVVFYFAGPTPEPIKFIKPYPKETSPEEAIELYYATRKDERFKDDNQLKMLFKGSITPYALLYLHGFSASPEEGMPTLQNVADHLHWNMYAPLVQDHGLITDEPLKNFSANLAYQDALEALSVAKALGDSVIIMATSTGCALAHLLAAQDSRVAGLVYYSPNVRPVDPLSALLNDPWGLQIAESVLGSNYRDVGITDPYYEQYWYRYYRTESLPEMQELIETAFDAEITAQITQPLFIGAWYENDSVQDDAVSVPLMRELYEAIPHSNKSFHEFAAGSHVIANGMYSKAQVELEAQTLEFLGQFVSRASVDSTKHEDPIIDGI